MESGDGLIVRVHPKMGALSTDDVRTLAQLALAYGNGQLELTRRANIQIRGITAEGLPALQTELVRHGLAEATPERERAASLVIDPLSGLDPECAIVGPLAEAIDRVLGALPTANRLPAKCCIVLDGGGGVVRAISADIRVDLRRAEPDIAYLSVGDRDNGSLPLGSCPTTDAPSAVRALLQILSFFQEEGGRRMRDVIAMQGVEAVRASVDPLLLDRRAAPPHRSRASVIGLHTGIRNWFGLALPFGSGDVEPWNAIATIAERFGSGQIRLTPTRSVLIADVRVEEQAALAGVARDHGLIIEESDPLLRVTACVGAPACEAAEGETRALGRDLSELLRPLLAAGATVHVSGCSKSCALTGPASITMVRDREGCQLGLDQDVAQTSRAATLSLPTARHHLAVMARDFAGAAADGDVSPFLRSYAALIGSLPTKTGQPFTP
jgi:precorrin-3B synthase